MKILLPAILLLLSSQLFGQIAIINDKDGYVNVRKAPNAQSEILRKFYTNDVFYCDDIVGDWYSVSMNSPAYIHKSRVKLISNLYSPPKSQIADNILIFTDTKCRIEITTKSFKPQEYKTEYDSSKSYFKKINDSAYSGNDIPDIAYKSIKVIIGSTSFLLPQGAIANVFDPNNESTEVNFDAQGNTYYISSHNSDGANAYVVLWMIKNGKYIRRMIFTPV